MTNLFEALTRDTIAEFERRRPGFLGTAALAVPSVEALLDHYAGHPLTKALGPAVLEHGLVEGLQMLERIGVVFARRPRAADPLALVLIDGLIDAFAAEEGALELRPAPAPEVTFEGTVAADFEPREMTGGRRYFARRSGHVPLLLIGAHGVPATPWHLLAADPTHDFKLILFESRSSDLFAGGARPGGTMDTDIQDILDILDREEVDRVSLLSWCSGSRVAVEFATRHASRLDSLILLAPTFHGMSGLSPMACPMEDSLATVFTTIIGRPKLATHFVNSFREREDALDWSELSKDPPLRAAEFTNLPAQSHEATLLRPFATAESLVNYATRIQNDKTYQEVGKLSRLGARLLLITGDSDKVVNNDLTRSALRRYGGAVTAARVSGAGHYIHDLQYRYFRLLVACHLQNRALPLLANRLRISGSGSL